MYVCKKTQKKNNDLFVMILRQIPPHTQLGVGADKRPLNQYVCARESSNHAWSCAVKQNGTK
jgi:hypothetical protein